MATARDIMHPGAECVNENETLVAAASKMRELQVGALPICGPDDKLRGILTDRDIVVRAIAHGRDPHTTTVRELAQGTPIWVDADATVDEAIEKMVEHKVRRLPVIDDHRLVGMISEADLARNCSQAEVAHFATEVYSAPPSRL
ncbi:MAG TPA: CBS domain-containing protein [Natronosporangium sp.]